MVVMAGHVPLLGLARTRLFTNLMSGTRTSVVRTRDVTTFERNLSQLEEQLEATLDAAERERLLRLLIREIRNFAQNEEFCPSLERHIAARAERIKKQRALVARLKRDGRETRNAQFLLVTLLTMQAMSLHHHAIARQTLKLWFVSPDAEHLARVTKINLSYDCDDARQRTDDFRPRALNLTAQLYSASPSSCQLLGR